MKKSFKFGNDDFESENDEWAHDTEVMDESSLYDHKIVQKGCKWEATPIYEENIQSVVCVQYIERKYRLFVLPIFENIFGNKWNIQNLTIFF